MSDVVKKWVVGAALGAAVSLGALFLHYQIRSQVEQQMAVAGIPPREMIVEMQKDIEANRALGEDNKVRADKLDTKIEKIVDILLED